MARFRFKLQAVLNHREMVEEERQRAVAAIERERVRLEEIIRDIQRTLVQEQRAMRESLLAGDMAGARRQSAAATHLDASARRTVLELAGVHKRLQVARAALLEASKARKAVDLLRERHLEAWRTEQNRREAAAVDEIAVMRAGRAASDAIDALPYAAENPT